MHLWPSLRLRDSFKKNYLKNLEWNLNRMNSQKQQESQSGNSSNQQKLLNEKDRNENSLGFRGVMFFRELLMILSCCYCCFCCGACIEDDESS